jgi:hypothetical protein
MSESTGLFMSHARLTISNRVIHYSPLLLNALSLCSDLGGGGGTVFMWWLQVSVAIAIGLD